LNGVVFASAYGMLGLGLFFWRDAIVAGLTHIFGPRAPAHWPVWTILTIATVLQLLAYELAYWFGHFLFHKVPALWEFHKVHHSAEVMTTLTELCQHPVEIIAFVNLIGFATGIVFGVMTYAFGPGVQPFTLLNGNILLMMFLITYGHLRHSHMWIPFTGVAGRILQSPAHHQLHHSDDPSTMTRTSAMRWLCGTGRSARSRFLPRRASQSCSASPTRLRRSAPRSAPSSGPARALASMSRAWFKDGEHTPRRLPHVGRADRIRPQAAESRTWNLLPVAFA